jgi:hypothetical protein
MRFAVSLMAATILTSTLGLAQATPAAGPYKVLDVVKVGGVGGFDYVYADADGRRLYIPRSGGATGRITVFDLDTLKSVGEVANVSGVHGAVVDPATGHGFASSKPVVMFDSKTLATIKTIPVDGAPDGIFFEPFTKHVFILSHRAPNVTVLDAADGSVVGTIDLGGAPEQGASDGKGHVYIDVEDKDNVAVVDAQKLQVTGHYDLSSKGKTPAGLALDVQNHILFAFCREPATAVILNADTGEIITSLPTGNGVDGASFNPATMEAFSSQRDGTLTVIKENSATNFEVEQTVKTRQGARTSTLDSKTGKIFLIAAEMAAPAAPAAPTTQPAGGRPQGGPSGGRGQMVPDSFMIITVGK